jgi:hypothetical protein
VRRNNHTKVVEAGLKRQLLPSAASASPTTAAMTAAAATMATTTTTTTMRRRRPQLRVAPAKVKRQPKAAKKAAAAAAEAAAAAVARRTFFHHPANQKPQSVELLVRCADSVDKAIAAVFEGGRYVAAPAAMTVLSLRTYVAQRLQVSVDQVRLTIPAAAAAAIALDDRMPVSRIVECWFERGPTVVEVALGRAVVDNTVVLDD